MSSKPGYKITEIGEIPEDWEVMELRSVVKDHKAGIYKPRKIYGSGYNIVGVSDLYYHDSIKGQTFRLVRLTEEEKNEFSLKEGDIIYGESSLVKDGIGKALVVTKAGEGTVFAWHTRRLTLDRSKVAPLFIHHVLNSRLIRRSIINRSTQTALTGVTVKDYFDTLIPLPLLPEQQKIASILSSVDEAIQKTDEIIQKAQELKKGLMQQLLTKGIGHTKFKQTEIGEVPEEWPVFHLEKVVKFIKSGISREFSSYDIGYPVIRSTNIQNNRLDLTDVKYWHLKDPQKANLKNYIIEDGDILVNFINSINQIGKCCIFRIQDRDFIYTTNIFRVKLDQDILLHSYFHFFAQTSIYQNQIYRMIKPAVQQASITHRDFQKIEIPTPPIWEQQKIVSVLAEVDNKIEKEKQRKEQLEKLKKGLMQDLLTGRVRVKVD